MIFLDSSFLLASFNYQDGHHHKAVKIINDVARPKYGNAFLTDYIFNETVTVALIRMKDIGKVKRIGNYLLSSVKLIQIEEEMFSHAWEIFQSQKTTKLSFTDCTTIATMKNHGIENIATFDNDFTKIDGIHCIGP